MPTILNRREIEENKRLAELEAQEKDLLEKMGGSFKEDFDISALEGDHLEDQGGSHDDEAEARRLQEEQEAEAQRKAEAAEADEARKQEEAERKRAEDEARKKAEQEQAKPKKLDQSDPNYWQKQAETWKKRKSDADRALTPAQEEAARLRKELEELKTKQQEDKFASLTQEDKFASLTKEIESLREALASNGRPAQSKIAKDEALEPELDAELNALRALNPEFARLAELEAVRMRKSMSSVNEDLKRQLEEVREAKAKMEQEREQIKRTAATEAHRAFVTSKHPDVDEIYNYAFDKLLGWAAEDSPEYVDIVRNPLSVSPQRFSKVISEFKRFAAEDTDDAPGNQRDAGKPAGGDLATRVRKAAPASKPGSGSPELLTDEQMANFESLMQSHRLNPEKQEELLKRFELTIASMES